VASRLGVALLHLGDIPVFREGNVIRLSNATLEVAEACSGIRSLISLLTLGLLYGYLCQYSTTRRIALAVVTIPIAIAANGLRVAGAGVVAEWLGPAAVEGFLHTFSGFVTFFTSLLMLRAFDQVMTFASRSSSRGADAPELVGS
jgi:exosortase